MKRAQNVGFNDAVVVCSPLVTGSTTQTIVQRYAGGHMVLLYSMKSRIYGDHLKNHVIPHAEVNMLLCTASSCVPCAVRSTSCSTSSTVSPS